MEQKQKLHILGKVPYRDESTNDMLELNDNFSQDEREFLTICGKVAPVMESVFKNAVRTLCNEIDMDDRYADLEGMQISVGIKAGWHARFMFKEAEGLVAIFDDTNEEAAVKYTMEAC